MNKPITKIVWFFLAGFLLTLVLTSFMTTSAYVMEEDEGGDDDGDGIDDEVEQENERHVETEFSDKAAKIQSELKYGDQKDKIEVSIEVEDEPKFKLQYASESNSTEMELDFTVKFYSIVEYVDTDADNMFNASVDEEIQEYRLDKSAFHPLQYENTTMGNATVHIFTINTTDGVLLLRLYAVGEFAVVNDELITPTEVKIDVEIHDFPYENDSSQLALKTRLEAAQEYEEDDLTDDEEEGHSEGEKEVEVTIGNYTGFFSWAEMAVIDGINQSVLTSPVEADDNSTDQKMCLNYPRGMDIIHDPKIGVAGLIQTPTTPNSTPPTSDPNLSPEGNDSPTSGYLFAVTALSLVVSSLLVVNRRKRR